MTPRGSSLHAAAETTSFASTRKLWLQRLLQNLLISLLKRSSASTLQIKPTKMIVSPRSLTILLLGHSLSQHGVDAFLRSFECPHRIVSVQIATQSSQNTFEDVLEDHDGKINPELAQHIFKWERQQRLNLDLPDFQSYSTRDGLRWVKERVNKTLQQARSASKGSERNPGPNSDDLIQEGVFALLQALSRFEHESRPGESLTLCQDQYSTSTGILFSGASKGNWN